METSPLTISDIIERMQQVVPPGSPPPEDPNVLAQLRQLTQDLIQAYQAAGRLQGDPFYEAWTRPLHLYETEVRHELQGKVVLVTGGEGCVGTYLINKLIELGPKRIVSIDKARGSGSEVRQPIAGQADNVVLYAADIRDYDATQQIFEAEKPEIVFHVAAQRHPGLAEKQIRETVTSNIFGTINIIRLCEEFGVQHCIFSSTGKASRYFTAEVYAASKKVAEWLFAQATQRGHVRYGMVRFTHMLENSAMCEQISGRVEQGLPVNIHAPDRYVAGQNVGEAVHLLLNGLVLSERDRLKFLLVRNLGWPTESLEVALYKIMESGQDLPIYFQGVQPGYEESFFLGQVDWDDQIDINTLINALETAYNSSISSSGDMIVADLVPFSAATLDAQLQTLKALCDDLSVPEPAIKQGLAEVIRQVAKTNFLEASPKKALQILRWGVNPKRFQQGDLKLEAYQDIVEILVQSLCDRLSNDVLKDCNVSTQDCEELLDVLATLPSIQSEVARMRSGLSEDASGRVAATL
ncbi:SDR family NAD(P)-dependent oxidoreductase [Pantanalinema sp. GBBB05]|uniref:SDR family NAD(P)-dependent oxidoreductase n=1 Tax=Pantanalinema sp. GBBB05 TaxID=2604139 RepID=UPI001DE7D943|nr:SDR family NAD(P)-dependent oxidoreductase [Pantanalinema sp. GBBB05]